MLSLPTSAERGDVAVRAYSEKFDGWSPERFRLDQSQIDRIVEGCSRDRARRHRGRTAPSADVRTASKGLAVRFRGGNRAGVFLGQKNLPVSAAGAYVPGGRYPLVASAHMTVVTAQEQGERGDGMHAPDQRADSCCDDRRTALGGRG